MKTYKKMSNKELKRTYTNLLFRSMTYGRGAEEAEKALKELERRSK